MTYFIHRASPIELEKIMKSVKLARLFVFYFMKKLIFIGALILTLSSCTNTPPTPVEVNTGAVTGTESVTQTGIVSPSVSSTGVVTTGSIVTVNYTLHVDTPTGKVEDTSLEEVARANGLYRTGGTYQPLQVVIGQQQVIPGFEN